MDGRGIIKDERWSSRVKRKKEELAKMEDEEWKIDSGG